MRNLNVIILASISRSQSISQHKACHSRYTVGYRYALRSTNFKHPVLSTLTTLVWGSVQYISQFESDDNSTVKSVTLYCCAETVENLRIV